MTSLREVARIREAITKTTRMLAQDKVEVRQRGGVPHVKYRKDGRVEYVNLPIIPDNPSDEFLAAVQGFLDHEVAHVLFTNNIQLNAYHDRAVAERMNPFLLRSMANAFEDHRINKAMCEKFKGSAQNITNCYDFVLTKIVEPGVEKALENPNPTDRTVDVIAAAFIAWLRSKTGHVDAQRFMDDKKLWDHFKTVDKAFPDFERRLNAMVTSEDAAALAYAYVKALTPPPPPPPPPSPAPKKEPSKDKKKPKPKDEAEGDPEDSEDSEEGGEGEETDKDSEGKGTGKKHEPKPEAEEEGEPDAEGDEERPAPGADGDEPEEGEEEGEEPAGAEPGEEDPAEAPKPEEEAGEEPGSEGEAGEDEDDGEEEGGSGGGAGGEEPPPEPEKAPGADGEEGEEEGGEEPIEEGVAVILREGLADVKDMDEMMAEVIGVMMKDEFSETEYVEYTRDFDVIEKLHPPVTVDISAMEADVSRVAGVLQKDLQRIIVARSQAVNVPGFRRGRLNPGALHRIDHDDRMFRRKQTNTTKKVAVSLVVDNSGSMSGSKLQLAMKSAWAFAQVLDRLGVNNEVIGFTTKAVPDEIRNSGELQKFAEQLGKGVWDIRGEPLWLPIYKEFGERFTLEQKRRMAWVHDGDGVELRENIDGASVLEAAKRLLLQKEERKLMIVFSDGNPAGRMDNSILRTHLKKVVQEIERNGIETIGIGIMDESVKRFYPKHFVVRDLEELPGKVMNELRQFLLK